MGDENTPCEAADLAVSGFQNMARIAREPNITHGALRAHGSQHSGGHVAEGVNMHDHDT